MPEDLETPDDEQPADDNPVIRELRQKANRTEVAESKVTELQRELVVHKAGLTDLTDKQLKALSAAHEGDWEPELLKATATELGFGTATVEQPEQPKISSEELDAHQRMAAAAGGQPTPPTDFDAALIAAATPEERHELLRNAGLLAEQ